MRYVGLVASRRRGAARARRAARRRASPTDALARVRTPAGLDIGARTHAEIALSILAELVAVRRAPAVAVGRRAAAPPPREAVDPVCGMTVVVGPGHADGRRRRRSAARAAADALARACRLSRSSAGLVLAAGGSSRLGRPKQLLPYRGATLLDAVLDTARACGFDQLLVALGGAADDVRAHGRPDAAPRSSSTTAYGDGLLVVDRRGAAARSTRAATCSCCCSATSRA